MALHGLHFWCCEWPRLSGLPCTTLSFRKEIDFRCHESACEVIVVIHWAVVRDVDIRFSYSCRLFVHHEGRRGQRVLRLSQSTPRLGCTTAYTSARRDTDQGCCCWCQLCRYSLCMLLLAFPSFSSNSYRREGSTRTTDLWFAHLSRSASSSLASSSPPRQTALSNRAMPSSEMPSAPMLSM